MNFFIVYTNRQCYTRKDLIMYLHVRVETSTKLKNGTNTQYFQFDFKDREQIKRDFIQPYFINRTGEIFISGSMIDVKNITQISVRLSTIDSQEISKHVQQEIDKENHEFASMGAIIFNQITNARIFNNSTHSTEITNELVGEVKEQTTTNQLSKKSSNSSGKRRYFISHCVKDKVYATCVMELLEAMGVHSDDIFCCSADGNGIPIGEDWKSYLHKELNDNTFVIFLLSENFYKSPVCLCEMGAAWIMTKEHAPILIPPAGYHNLQGVITTQAFKINEATQWTLLTKQLGFEPDQTIWERKRNTILSRMPAQIDS